MKYRMVHILPCLADPDRIRAIMELDEEIHETFPYLNGLLKGCIYNHEAMILTLKKEGKMITLYSRKVTIAKATDEDDVRGTMEWIQRLLQEVKKSKGELQPDFSRGVELKALDTFRLLPGTNCRACGELTCLAFAVKMASGGKSLLQCAPLFTPSGREKRGILIELLRSAGYTVPGFSSGSIDSGGHAGPPAEKEGKKLRKRVLFICTRNSARSQMAEALVNHDLAGRVEAFSAGTAPSAVHPLAVAVMQELGMDISRQRSKGLEEFAGHKFDYVITLCSEADEACPVFFGGTRKLHMGFPDPAAAGGSREEQLAAFRRVRDQIRAQVVGFLETNLQEDIEDG